MSLIAVGVILPLSLLASMHGPMANRPLALSLIFLTVFFSTLAFLNPHDLLAFYVLFELASISVSLLSWGWSSRVRGFFAARLLFLYSALGSVPFLLPLSFSYDTYGGNLAFFTQGSCHLFSSELLYLASLSVPFIVKTPLVPFHYWLLEAHVESHSSVSILLAGIFLKFGFFGFALFLLPSFDGSFAVFRGILFSTSLFSALYVSLLTVFQFDLKRIIAYSSVVHMSFSASSIACDSEHALISSWICNLAHGLYSPCLFYCVGHLYRYSGTRSIVHLGGISSACPRSSFSFLASMLSAVGFPGTLQFLGELEGLISLLETTPASALLMSVSPFLAIFYFFWSYGRVFHGPVSTSCEFPDLSSLESSLILLYSSVGFLAGLGIGVSDFSYLTRIFP